MIISQVEIHNILGIEHRKFHAGKITQVTGENGTGKTSIIEAIRGALGGGSLAKLIRNGEDSAKTVIVFSDGTELTTKITPTKTDRKVKNPAGFSAGTAKQWLDANVNFGSFNPIEFVEAKPKDRLELVLNASELDLDFADLVTAARPIPIDKLIASKSGKCPDPLGAIELIDKRIRETRTEVNRSIKDKKAHISELEQTLPATPTETPPATPTMLRRDLDELKQQMGNRKLDITKAEQAETNKINAAASDEERAAREELAAKLKAIADRKAAAIGKAVAATRTALDSITAEFAPKIDSLNAEIGKAESLVKEAETHDRTRKSIHASRDAVAELESESEAYSKAIDKLEKLKLRVMERLPVPGLGVFGGELYWGQIRVETLNTAELIDVAMRIAEVTSGVLKVVCLDGFERLGRKRREAFERRAAGSDCQFFVTRVVDDASLTISSDTPDDDMPPEYETCEGGRPDDIPAEELAAIANGDGDTDEESDDADSQFDDV